MVQMFRPEFTQEQWWSLSTFILESLFALIACTCKKRLLPCTLGAHPSGFVAFSSAETPRSIMTEFEEGNLWAGITTEAGIKHITLEREKNYVKKLQMYMSIQTAYTKSNFVNVWDVHPLGCLLSRVFSNLKGCPCEIKFKLFIVLCRWYSANVLNKKDKKVKLADFNFSRWYDHLISAHNTDPRSKVKIQGFILFDKRLKRWRIERGPFLKGDLGDGFVAFLKCSILWDWIIQWHGVGGSGLVAASFPVGTRLSWW